MLGMRILWFERDWQGFKSPRDWSRQAVAMTTTHDLPTVAGWWEGRDIDWRTGLGLLGEGHSEAGERDAREREKRELASAFERAGLTEGPAEALPTEVVVDAAIAYVGMTPSPLPIVPLEDLLGEREQPNLPGTIAEHPNWRRRPTAPASSILDDAAPARRLARLRTLRGAAATEEVS
jgi:4-alpha-glucanotransferase